MRKLKNINKLHKNTLLRSVILLPLSLEKISLIHIKKKREQCEQITVGQKEKIIMNNVCT